VNLAPADVLAALQTQWLKIKQLSVLGDIDGHNLRLRGSAGRLTAKSLTASVSGGPPSFTGRSGEAVLDAKYGITWWSDGTTWHASGAPGLILARLHLASTTYNPGTSQVQFAFDTKTYDPLGIATTGASANITVPLAGRYRLAVSYKVNGTIGGCGALIYAGSSLLAFSKNPPANYAYAGNEIVVVQTLAAGAVVLSEIIMNVSQDMQVDNAALGANNFLEVEFLGS
jgi:hypothetical protein